MCNIKMAVAYATYVDGAADGAAHRHPKHGTRRSHWSDVATSLWLCLLLTEMFRLGKNDINGIHSAQIRVYLFLRLGGHW